MHTICNIMYTDINKGVDKMSTVRINEKIKQEIIPILDDLGISLSEAINMFLHQIKLNNGIPFELKRKGNIELNDGYGSYICEYGHLHDYSKLNLNDIEKEGKNNKTYNNAKEMIDDILRED